MGKKTNWITGGLAALAAAGAMMSLPASAQTSINLQIGTPPPPVRYEVMPQPRRGYVWVPGHWEWRGNRHVWKAGYFLAARPGYYYQQPTWVQEGGATAMRARFKNPTTRKRILRELELGIPSRNSDPKDVMMLGFIVIPVALFLHETLGKATAKFAQNNGKQSDDSRKMPD